MAEGAAGSEAAFCLQNITITDDYKEDYQYEEVSADDDFSLQEEDEDLSKALQAIQEQAEDAQILTSQSVLTAEKSVADIPEAMDDFFCNFLVRLGMSRTLDCFQTEWYELIERGVFTVNDAGLVPTVYTHNQQLELENMRLKKDLENYRLAVNKTKEALIKMQKERDFHRMHHKRVVQEKNRLISDMKRLKAHYASYEPVLKQLTAKYEATLKQKMLTSLERDRAVGQVISLQAALEDLESGSAKQNSEAKVSDCTRKKEFEGAPQKALQEARQQKIISDGSSSHDPVKETEKKMDKRDLKHSEFPVDPEVSTNLECAEAHPQPLECGEYRLSSLVKVHDFAVSCLALHPRKDLAVTGSDDHLWKLWAVPAGNILLTGAGHTDWLSGCCFRPSEKCRHTLRGHKDSVNSIEFLPFSNTVLTSSADKTLSLWDCRTGLRVYTFHGHLHSCNHATFNMKGDTIASCDSSGVLKLWDIRKLLPVLSIDAGPHPANQVAFDPSGGVVALGSSDGSVRLLRRDAGQLSALRGPGGAVRCLRFHGPQLLLSAGSDGRVCLWTAAPPSLGAAGKALDTAAPGGSHAHP
ncbi:sperm-associated antigen 16 protein isoform X2 [Pithys albifrons albifrons]|uniref:sperm-associated antigen 16 protein isoform X2 n=1 Tax=Pithys albifrons albifrons TaxID=3385563 RepID=UPI003A5CCBAF